MFSILNRVRVSDLSATSRDKSETRMKERERLLSRIGLCSWFYVARDGRVFVWIDSQQPAVVCGSW